MASRGPTPQHGRSKAEFRWSPSRGPERLIRSGQWLIALLFAYVLIQVGASLIADLPLLPKYGWDSAP